MIKVEDAIANLQYQILRFEKGTEPYLAIQMAIKALEQKQKSEWEHDHEILKAYSDGANGILDKIKDEFIDRYPRDWANGLELGGRSCVFSLNEILRIIDKYKAESEEGAEDGR